MIESIRNYILTCPFLDDLKRVGVEFLSEDPTSYSIEETPAKAIIEEYIDGSSKRQFEFVFASRFDYSEEIKNQIENSGFYEKFSDWVEENSENGILPTLDQNKTALELEVLTSGYLYNIADNMRTARYQIQMRLIYRKEEKSIWKNF